MSNIVAGIDITKWAPEEGHEKMVTDLYNNIKKKIAHLEQSPYLLASGIDNFIQNNSKGSPMTSKMVLETASKYKIDPALIMAIAQADSSYGTKGKGSRSNNPGNWGTFNGKMTSFSTLEEGVDVIGRQLARYRGDTNYVMPKRNISYEETSKNTIENSTKVPNYSTPIIKIEPDKKDTPVTKVQELSPLTFKNLPNFIGSLQNNIQNNIASMPITGYSIDNNNNVGFINSKFIYKKGGKICHK